MDVIRWLADLRRTDTDLVGGKAANLGELVRGGFPVPAAFVVTTEAYDAVVAPDLAARIARIANGVTSEAPASATNAARAIADAFAAVPIPAETEEQIVHAYVAMGSPTVAVRSSATTEDLAGASSAGQQETILGITTPGGVLDAVRRCWASLWSERALVYRARQAADGGAEPRLSLAVVVQRLVAAEASGVMFTVNPLTGADEVVIDAVHGLGESSVAGLVTPDTYVLRRHDVVVTRGDQSTMVVPTGRGTETRPVTTPGRVLDDAQVTTLATTGRQVAELLGGAQDIEWALDRGTLWLLQARPVTATGEPPSWEAPDPDALYFRASIIEQLPDPLTPLFADMTAAAVPAGLVPMVRSLGIDLGPTPGISFVTINGYAYYEFQRAAFLRLLRRTPSLLPTVLGDGLVGQWRDEAEPRYRALVAEWEARDPAELSATELLDGARRVLAGGCAYYAAVQGVIPQVASAEMAFQALYEHVARRDDDPAASTYLLGYDSEPLRAEKDLYALAVWARDHGVGEALSAGADPLGPRPDDVDETAWRGWQAELQTYLDLHGHTVFTLDFATPVPADDPSVLMEALRFHLSGGPDPAERQRAAAAEREHATRTLLRRLGPVRRRLLEPLLRRAQETAPLREDALAEVGLGWPVLRRLLLELGGRLVAQRVLRRADEVFWLTEEEAAAYAALLDARSQEATTGTPPWPGDAGLAAFLDARTSVLPAAERQDLAQRIGERHTAWQRRRHVAPPGLLPRTGMMAMFEHWMPTNEQPQTGPVIHGLGASGGVVEGVARVVTAPSELATLRQGEILVASITTPAFTPLFALAAGVVTDVGGLLSHSSIVAREYGIPAVLGTGVATRRIQTGDRVRIDGDAGTVILLDAGLPVLPEVKARRGIVAGGVTAAALAGAGMAVLRWARRRA